MTRERLAWLLAAGLLGLAAADASRRAPGFSLAGDSLPRVALGVAAGWAVVAAGLALGSGGVPHAGRLLAAAGCAWLAAGLGTPGARLAPLFTLGLVVIAAAPALMAHAVLLAAPDGFRSSKDRLLPAALYLSFVGLLGLLSTLMFDPAAGGCASCPRNLLGLADAPARAADLSRWGIRLGLVVTACTVAFALWRLARAPAVRRLRAAPLVLPGCAYLVLVIATLGHSWTRGFLGNDPVDQALWSAEAAALLGVAAGVTLLLAGARRQRSRLTRLVVELDAQRPGGLRQALASVLGDPGLELLYASPSDGAWIDLAGQLRTPPPGTATTQLVREGRPVALLCHRAGLLDDPRLAAEIERSARLGLEHERLQSELRHQLAHLRTSRADVAAAAEAERRLLERDLHDGAQQRLVALAYALGVARSRARTEHAPALEAARLEVQAALAELRELAHGLYPVALADAGLGAALESLSDRRAGLRIATVPSERFPSAIEEAAYLVIASLADLWSPTPVTLNATVGRERLVVDLRTTARPPSDVVDLEDRVGAFGGSVVVVNGRSNGQTHVRLQLPCG